MSATVFRAPHLRAFDGLRRVWCADPVVKAGEKADGCRRSFWVPLLSRETRCPTCRSYR